MTDQQPNERDQRDQQGRQGRHGPGTAGAWQPVPGGGDYDPDQTMHVSFAAQLPPEPRPGEDPLGAHGPAGPGWSGHPDEEAGYLENGGYQVGQPLYGPGPDGGSAYDYRPQEQPGPHGGHSGGLPGPGSPERPYEHGGHGGYGGGPDVSVGGAGGGHGDGGAADGGSGTGGAGAGGIGGAGGTGGVGGAGGSGGDHDPATAWSIPVIREETEAESGEYSLGAFSPSWEQTPSPAPTQSFPAGMFGQGAAAAAQAARERAAAERERGGAETPSDPGSGHWEMPFTGPEGGDAVPWLPAHAPAADAAWSGIVDDPEGPPPAPHAPHVPSALSAPSVPSTAEGIDTGQDRPAGHDAAAGDEIPYAVPSFDQPSAADEPAAYGEDLASTRPDGPDSHGDPADPADPADFAGPADLAGPDDARESAATPGAHGPDDGQTDQAAEVAEPADVSGTDGASPHDVGHDLGSDVGSGLGSGVGSDVGAGPGQDGQDGSDDADGIPLGDAASDGDPGAAPDAAADFGSADAGSADPDPAEPFESPEPTRSEHPLASYMLRVNGTDRPVTDAWLGESLLYVLRERLGLAGAKDGCEQGECGACSVQVDGRLVASCLVPAATAAGSEVRTVEGLTVDGRPSDVQCALADSGAVQCGFCIPGMAMTVHDLLEGNHKPTDLDVRQALSGNLCRCSGYRGVLDAVRSVVAARDTGRDPDDPAAAGPDDPARVPHQGGSAGSGGAQ